MDSDVVPKSSNLSRWWALGEIVAIVGLIEVYLWLLKETSYQLSKSLMLVSIVVMVGIGIWGHRSQLPEKKSVVKSWLKTLSGSLVLAVVLMLCAWGLDVINVDSYSSYWTKFVNDHKWWQRKFGTVVVQQIALQLCLLPACVTLLNSRWKGIVLSAFLFGMIHSPNPYLMLMTIAGGGFWCWIWLDSRRMMPLICSHLLLAILAREYCNDALYNMRVGSKVFELFPQQVTSASGESFLNDPMLLSGTWDVEKIEDDEVVCQGWAADVGERELVDELIVYSAVDQKLCRVPFEPVQSDYARQAYGPKLEEAGFRIRIPLASFRRAVKFYAYREGVGYSKLPYAPEDAHQTGRDLRQATNQQMRRARMAAEHSRKLH